MNRDILESMRDLFDRIDAEHDKAPTGTTVYAKRLQAEYFHLMCQIDNAIWRAEWMLNFVEEHEQARVSA